MDTKILAAALVGFLFGGLTVSVAAELEDENGSPHGTSQHGTRDDSRSHDGEVVRGR